MQSFSSIKSIFCKIPKLQSLVYRAYCNSFGSHLELSENPYYKKYADKISKTQVSSEDLQNRLKRNQEVFESLSACNKGVTNTVNSKEKHVKISLIKKKLNQIMKVDIIKDKSAEEIESIWKHYHKSKDGIYAVLPGKSFTKMFCNLKEYPTFLFPLPRAQGYEYVMCQYLDQSCYFTSLVNYQALKENAPICFTLTYYTEFQSNKDIVLMQGEYDASILKAHEAQCLTNQLQLYYGSDDHDKLKLVHIFNKKPECFKHFELISNFETSLGNFNVAT